MENNIMNRPQPHCPVVEINGKIAKGNQFDLDIRLPEDDREVIYGVIKDRCNNPVKDAVVKLVEIERKDCKERREPVSHTFTDKYGEFVFGPLCPNKEYAIDIWLDNVRHFKVCAECQHEGKCLKGEPMQKCDFNYKYENECENNYCDKYENSYEDKCNTKCENKCEKKCEEKKDKCEKNDPCKYESMNKCKPSCAYNPMDKCGYMVNKR